MAEVEDGSLTLEARITLMDKDVQNMKSQLNDIGKTGERVGNMLDNSLTAGFSGLGNVITDVSQQVISKLEEMLNQGKASAGAIVDETEKVQEKLDEVGKDKNSFDGVKEGAKSASEEVGNNLVAAIEKAKKSLLALGAGFSAKEIIGQIGSIRSEFQQLEVSFETMLGSKELSDQLMNQLVNTAAHTPFDLKGIADGARQLLAYGAAAEDVNDTLVMLGDIAAGLSMPLGDLVYLYGTTMTQGRVFAQDMHQFMGRGIPLAETLAEQMGRNKEEISELVSKGKVGFTEVDKALRSMVEDGGKFANLMDKQSHTIGGLKSNLEDAIDMMFNDIGKQSENLFSSALSAAINVVENYQRIGRAVAELGVAIGSYKALMVALNAVQKISNIYQMQSVKAKAANAAATQGVIIKETGAAIATKMWAKAQAQLNLALKATGLSNPYVALAAAVTAFGFALYKAMTYQTDFEKMMKETEKAAAESTAQANAEILSLETLKGKLAGCKRESEEYLAVKDLIVAKYSKYDETLKEEGLTYDMLVEKLKGVKKAIEESISARAAEEQLSKNQQKLTEDYAKNIEKLNEKLLKRLSPEMAARAGQEIARALAEGTLEAEADWDRSGILPKTFLNLKGVSAEVAEAVKKASISIGENFDMWSLKIWMAVANCKNLNKEMRELPQLTYGKFGLDYEQQNQPKEVTASMEMSDKGSKDRISKIRKENAEIADALASGELETARAKIAAMQEGNLKVIAETELQWRKQVAADKLAKDKEYQERVKAQRELNEKSQKMYRDSVIELSNAKIDAESAGASMVLQNVTGEGKKLSVVLDNIQKEYERTIQKLENEKQKRENEIQDQIRTLEKENEKAGKSKELTPDQQGYINNMREMSNIQYQSGVAEATNKRNEEEKKALDDNVGVWKDYVQKYVELKEKFEKTQKEIMDSKTIDESAKPKLLENLNEQYANDSKILLNTLGLENDSVRTDIETLILTAYREATEGAVTKIQEEVLR
ncbi:MAG: tape measure protein, partial [Paludibacteraceae bacterium]|nr:tape measure protein [Paludibacteraceae bacterium]